MKWDELTDKDKVKLILQHVIPHDMGDDLVLKDNDIITPRGRGARAVNWPIAAWDEAIECWRTRDAGSNFLTPFDPVHNMNDAWEIVEKMVSRMGYQDMYFEWQGPLFKPEHQEIVREGYPLGTTCWFVTTIYKGRRITICAHTPQEAICKAALKAVGVEIE